MPARLRTAVALLGLAFPFGTFLVLRRVVALETLLRWAWHAPTRPRDQRAELLLVARVTRLSQLLGTGADCLPRSLLLYRELARRGADPRLHIGFAGRHQSLVGHAWVTVDGEPIGERASALAALTPVCAFGPGGRPIEE